MSCPFEEDLSAKLDGELPPARVHALDAHLPGCAACRDTLSLLGGAAVGLRALPEIQPLPAKARASVLAQIAEPPPARPNLWARLFRPKLLLPVLSFSAVAVVAVVLAPGGSVPEIGLPELALAEELEMLESMEVLGLESAGDLDVVMQLDELEVTP